MRDGTLDATSIWKRFRPDLRHRHLTQRVRSLLKAPGRAQWVWALRDVSCHLEPGDSLGLIGANGSGKSTMLKILNRTMYQTAGRLAVQGRVGALIEVSAGLHSELTGRENIYQYGSLIGMGRKAVSGHFDEIVAFGELDHAIDRQVKFYSSGMKMRIGFAVAAFLDPDILLIDEVLSVGDATFQQRCLDRMSQVLAQGTTLVYVSHDLQTVEATCQRAIWLNEGRALHEGPTREVLGAYRQAVEKKIEVMQLDPGDRGVKILEATVGSGDSDIPRTGQPFEVRLVIATSIRGGGSVHVGITEGPGTPILNAHHRVEFDQDKIEIRCEFRSLPLPRGRFFVWVAIRGQGRKTLVPWGPAASFDVMGPDLPPTPAGIVRLSPVYVEATWKQG